MRATDNDNLRKKIKKDIAEYLARGGVIQQIPRGAQKKVIKVDFVTQKKKELKFFIMLLLLKKFILIYINM